MGIDSPVGSEPAIHPRDAGSQPPAQMDRTSSAVGQVGTPFRGQDSHTVGKEGEADPHGAQRSHRPYHFEPSVGPCSAGEEGTDHPLVIQV